LRDRFGCEIPAQIRELYREHAAVERDYAARLLALAQKAVDKKNKKMVFGVVGDDPSKAWSEETLIQR
jgi:formin-binding protein 1